MKEKSQNKNKQNNSKSKPKPQNGKGDSPRNISKQFKENYDQINWRKSKK
jgi:hypothetical protein